MINSKPRNEKGQFVKKDWKKESKKGITLEEKIHSLEIPRVNESNFFEIDAFETIINSKLLLNIKQKLQRQKEEITEIIKYIDVLNAYNIEIDIQDNTWGIRVYSSGVMISCLGYEQKSNLEYLGLTDSLFEKINIRDKFILISFRLEKFIKIIDDRIEFLNQIVDGE